MSGDVKTAKKLKAYRRKWRKRRAKHDPEWAEKTKAYAREYSKKRYANKKAEEARMVALIAELESKLNER